MSVECLHVDTAELADDMKWCRSCGAICMNGKTWTTPQLHGAFIIRGWSCTRCGTFNGEEREPRTECRACGFAKEGVHG